MRLKTYKTPAWADRLIREVCANEGVRVPSVVWQKKPATMGTTGQAWGHRMRITAGLDRKACKEVVLHELVHVIQGQPGGSQYGRNHEAEFYAKLFHLGRKYRVGAAYIKRRETGYKPRGVKQGYRLYLKQLREAE